MIDFTYLDGTLFHNGIPFGILQKTGYVQGTIKGKTVYVHRLIWELHNYEIPEGYEIDHINGNKSDNRIENLRLATRRQNGQNLKKARVDSKSGYAGVQSKGNKWRARITVDGNVIRLGHFDTAEEAHMAYIKAKEMYHEFYAKEVA